MDILFDLLSSGMVLPNQHLFQQANVVTAVAAVSKLLAKLTNQKFLPQWQRRAVYLSIRCLCVSSQFLVCLLTIFVQAVKKEFQCLWIHVGDNDNDMRQQFCHLSSRNEGILQSYQLMTIWFTTKSVNNLFSRPLQILRWFYWLIQGTWSQAITQHRDKSENPVLLLQEQIKNQIHAAFYIGFAFPPFVVSCFGTFGITAVCCLYSLANLELLQHEAFLVRQHLAPLAQQILSPLLFVLAERLRLWHLWQLLGLLQLQQSPQLHRSHLLFQATLKKGSLKREIA
jgi:hypothetical protein